MALYLGGMGSRQRNYYTELFGRYGFAEEARRVQERYLERRVDEAMAAVTDEMIDLVTIIGPAPECRRRLAELERLGVAEVAIGLQVPGGGAPETLQALADLAAVDATACGFPDGGRRAAP